MIVEEALVNIAAVEIGQVDKVVVRHIEGKTGVDFEVTEERSHKIVVLDTVVAEGIEECSTAVEAEFAEIVVIEGKRTKHTVGWECNKMQKEIVEDRVTEILFQLRVSQY